MDSASVRYIVADVDEAVGFYTELLGFQLDLHPAPGFAQVSRGALRLLLNQPGAGGAGQAMPDGQLPAPGGWNRIRIDVEDLPAAVAQLEAAGGRFRNQIVRGNAGLQILLEDPSGNPIELFQRA
jgi:catechol 2,3-dioxygenase-like lactoylglutathione lyase family enzyme